MVRLMTFSIFVINCARLDECIEYLGMTKELIWRVVIYT